MDRLKSTDGVPATSTVSRRAGPGLTPSSLAISFTPLLTLLTSNRLDALQVAVLQIFTIFLVQFLAVFTQRKKETPLLVKSDDRQIKEEKALSDQRLDVEGSRTEKRNGVSPLRVESGVEERHRPVRARRSRLPRAIDESGSSSLHSVGEESVLLDEQPAILESKIEDTIKHLGEHRRIPSRQIPENALYPNTELDACLRHFLAILDASQLVHLPDSTTDVPAELPLSAWEQLLHTASSRVCKHPVIPHLYAVSGTRSFHSLVCTETMVPVDISRIP